VANEFQIRASLQVLDGKINYPAGSAGVFNDSRLAAVGKGPTPGVLAVSTTGVDVSFAQLSTPGWCVIHNLGRADGGDDALAYVEWGVHDGSLFHPVGELLAGQQVVIRLSRNLGEEETTPGTGTSAVANTFFLRANTAACNVSVEAFEA
jgi:hypothetical protein